MHICLDARLFGLKHAGIGRYTENLVTRLITDNPDHRFSVILPPGTSLTLPPKNYQLIPYDLTHYTIKEQLLLPRLLNSIPADLYHFTHFNLPLFFHRPFVVTIHDLLWHDVKDPQATTLSPIKYRLKYLAYQQVVRHAVMSSQKIIVPSQYVKNQIIKHYPKVDSAKIQVIYEGVDDHLLAGRFAKHPYQKQPYLIYVGSLYPHKNLKFLIQALNGRMHLKIVSARSVFQEELKSRVKDWGLDQAVEFLGFVSDPQLHTLVQGAVALVQPSLSEGFGLPGLEAMALGIPVLAADAGSMPEIYDNGALFFDPQDSQSFQTVLGQLLEDPKLRELQITHGLNRVSHFSWKKTASETMQVYKSVL